MLTISASVPDSRICEADLGGQGQVGGMRYIFMYKYTDQVFQLLTTTATVSYICCIIATLLINRTIMCCIYATVGIILLFGC